jgi:hypothetical protein
MIIRSITVAAVFMAAMSTMPTMADAQGMRPGASRDDVVSGRPSCIDDRSCGVRQPGVEQRIPPGYYRWDPPHYEYRPRYEYRRMSCSEAKRILWREGFRSIRTYDCEGSRYEFHAVRDGRAYRLVVYATDGRIVAYRA